MAQDGCSIIIPTYNRLHYLEKCIASLKRLSFTNYEIIVIDDFSHDGTKEYLENLKEKDNRVHVLHNLQTSGPSKSRNRGIRASQYGICAFIDDDCIADENWLRLLTDSFHDTNVMFVIGATHYIQKGYKGRFPERLVRNTDAAWPMSCNIAYRKEALNSAGYFDSSFDVYSNEDTELAIRMVQKGYAFVREPRAVVYHQQMNWTAESLLKAARNTSVWPILKRRYPEHCFTFGTPISGRIFIHPEDYAYLLTFPITTLLLFIRHALEGGKDYKIFFTRWPCYFFLKRYYLYRESIRNKILFI